MRARRLVFMFVGLLLSLVAGDSRAAGWPPPKGADMRNPANWPNDPGYQADWSYWSWLPSQAPGTPSYLGADEALGASGMSVDVGWTYTTGRPDVTIAIADSGIEWDELDLVDKAYLNAGELVKFKPQNADGSACGGAGPLAGYDCNGDGIFSVSDYAYDPRVSPLSTDPTDVCYPGADPTATPRAARIGDKNKNCVLDAGDLISLFSDGIDEDANGYTDDISGWDFYKNDNDPYDDTRSGHGTSQGRLSCDQGNNGIGDIGVCPDCRFVMLRVGDSFIADANDWAKAVVYAADNGAQVIQEALGAVDQTTFSKAAIDYAYAHGAVVVASMGNENSRHHNMPAAYGHTLPVHSIKPDGAIDGSNAGITTTSTTFLDFDTCSNFGGQNVLSVSADHCSDEATGRASGIAGLLLSEGLNQQLQLGPEEVMQLMKMTADGVYVPQSTSSNPSVAGPFFESLPYFSQRFGYGRPNVVSAMKAIDAGLIPPEVDLTSPGWFDVLYADRVTSPVPIVGRVSAKRAQSYDYRVEWAPGVEPADGDFEPIVDWVKNVPSTTTTGGSSSSPLGMLAPAEIDTYHAPDPDSAKFHENDRTITLRVLAIAHYASGDVNGEARRSVAIVNQTNGLDTDLAHGFPIAMGTSVEASPKLADIDGDGVRDIVVAGSDGTLHVFSVSSSSVPVELAGFPFHTSPLDGLNSSLTGEPTVPSYLNAPAYTSGSHGGIDPSIARETLVATPAVGDVNNDGKLEIVVSSWQGTVYVVASDGTILPGWPKRLPLVPSCPLDLPSPTATTTPCMDTGHVWSRGAGASPVLADFNHDGKLEIVQAAFDGNVYVWQADGTPLPGWPVLLHGARASRYNRIVSTPAVADFNGDGVPDVVSGSNEQVAGGGAGLAFLVDGRGMGAPGGPYLPHWPVVLASLDLLPLVAEGMGVAPAIADFEGTGAPQALFTGNGGSPTVFPADPGAQSGFVQPVNRGPCYDPDAGTRAPCGNGAQVGLDPANLFGAGSLATTPDTVLPLFSHPSVGDLDQDGVPDIVTSGGGQGVVADLTDAGSPAHPPQYLLGMWSGATGRAFYGSPVPIEDYVLFVNHAVADITGDRFPEVLLGTGGYFLHAVDACGCEAARWPKFTDGWIVTTPAVGDIDGDHSLEVVAGTRDGNLFAWHTHGTDTGTIQWESFHHDNANTGNYGLPLDQGVVKAAAGPIDCATDCAASPPARATTAASTAGGCGCRTISATDERTGWAALLGTALAALFVRQRRRR